MSTHVVITFFSMSTIGRICGSVAGSTLIWKDPMYYNRKKDAMSDWSQIGTIGEVFVILSLFFVGPMFDFAGRKWPLIIVQVVAAVCFIMIPQGNCSYF